MKTLLILLIVVLAGCSSRTFQHDIGADGSETYFYHSWSAATDTSADYVEIVLKDGTVIRVRKPLQDNDSMKAITPYGVYESE